MMGIPPRKSLRVSELPDTSADVIQGVQYCYPPVLASTWTPSRITKGHPRYDITFRCYRVAFHALE